MQAQIQKWGNSLGVRVPKILAQKLSLKSGSNVNMEVKNNQLIISYENSALDILVNQITPENRHKEVFYDDDSVGKEIW